MQPSLEHIEPGKEASLAWRMFEDKSWDFIWHFHPEVELTLVTAGHGQRFVGDSIEAFGPGDLALLGPNLPHTWHTPHTAQNQAPDQPAARSVVVQFKEDFAGPELWHRPEALPVRNLLQRSRQGLHFPKNHRGVADLMESMQTQNAWERMLTLLRILGKLATPLGNQATKPTGQAGRPLSGTAQVLPPRADDQKRIETVRRLIAERYTQPLCQSEIAQAIDLGPSAFSRFFKRMTGRTFVAYLHELRIAEACRHLAQGDCSVTDICFMSGFENVSNFNRVFRRLKNTNPRDYRRQIKTPPAGF